MRRPASSRFRLRKIFGPQSVPASPPCNDPPLQSQLFDSLASSLLGPEEWILFYRILQEGGRNSEVQQWYDMIWYDMIWCILGFSCFPFNQPLETSSPLSWDDHCAGSQADWSAIAQATATWRVWIPHLFRIARSCFKTDPVSPPWGLQVFVTHIFSLGFGPCWVSAVDGEGVRMNPMWPPGRQPGHLAGHTGHISCQWIAAIHKSQVPAAYNATNN